MSNSKHRNKNKLPPISPIRTQTFSCLLTRGLIMHSVQKENFLRVRGVLWKVVIMWDALVWDGWGFLDVWTVSVLSSILFSWWSFASWDFGQKETTWRRQRKDFVCVCVCVCVCVEWERDDRESKTHVAVCLVIRGKSSPVKPSTPLLLLSPCSRCQLAENKSFCLDLQSSRWEEGQ